MKQDQTFSLETERSSPTEVYKTRCVTYHDVLWLFIMGSVVGFVLEGLWNILILGFWENHTATIWGPFCIIYGIGAVVMYVLSSKIQRIPHILQFLIYATVGSSIEYFGSLFQELIFGTSSWNYSNHFLNIGGRVSLPMTILWGVLGICFAKIAFPHLENMLKAIKGKRWQIATLVMTVFMSTNIIFTAMTVWRWGERQSDIPASNVWEEYADFKYDDERMREIFPNWSFSSVKLSK